jgi:nucleoside-diphosphate-sugar epimerase
MKISIMGLGWYGTPLAHFLKSQGHDVTGTTRTIEKKAMLESQGLEVALLSYPEKPTHLQKQDIVVLNIPPFDEELSWFSSWNWDEDTWIIFISSTSVYPIPDSKSALLLKDQEEWVKKKFKKWTIMRFGGLLGNGRHPGKYLSGRKNLSGRLWPVNLIHQHDTIMATDAVIRTQSEGQTFHIVSDEHPTREEYYTDFCRKNGLTLPEFDMNDHSIGKLVPNDDIKSIYVPVMKL